MAHARDSLLHERRALLGRIRRLRRRIRDHAGLVGHGRDIREHRIDILLGRIDILELLLHALRHIADRLRHMHGRFSRLLRIGRELLGRSRYLLRRRRHLRDQLAQIAAHRIEGLRQGTDLIRRFHRQVIHVQIAIRQLGSVFLEARDWRRDAVCKGQEHEHREQQAHHGQHAVDDLHMVERREYKGLRHSNRHDPASRRYRPVGKELRLTVPLQLEIPLVILDHFLEMLANTIDFFDVLHRLADAGRSQDVARALHDEADALTVVFHLLSLFIEHVQCDIRAGRTDELAFILDWRRHRYDELARAGSYIRLREHRLAGGLGLFIPRALRRIFLARLIRRIEHAEIAILQADGHLQDLLVRNDRAHRCLRLDAAHVALHLGGRVGGTDIHRFLLAQPAIQVGGITGYRCPQLCLDTLLQIRTGHVIADD